MSPSFSLFLADVSAMGDTVTSGTYPPITATVSVGAPVPWQVTNRAAVSGGGAAAAGAEDLTVILPIPPRRRRSSCLRIICPTGVSLTPNLSWSAAAGAKTFNVYFGVSETPPFVGNTTATSYAPAALKPGTTYYWQIAANNGVHTSGSSIWRLTTVPAVPCAYTLTPTGASYTATGGTGSVTVTAPAGCPWTLSTTESWLSVSPGWSGMGNGNVVYLVAANADGARVGVLTIGGQAVTIAQLGSYLVSTFALIAARHFEPGSVGCSLSFTSSVAGDREGNTYFATPTLNSVYRVSPTGALSRLAGTGASGFAGVRPRRRSETGFPVWRGCGWLRQCLHCRHQ